LTAQVTCVKDNEGCGEQCAGSNDSYCVDFHGGRFRRAKVSVANIIRKDDWIEMNFSTSITRWETAAFWLGAMDTLCRHEVGAEILRGVVPKSSRPQFSSVLVRIAVIIKCQ
jgi:hypothetical protein